MASFNRFLVVPYKPEKMFNLVDRIEDYPDYLPWCSSVEVERQKANNVLATLHLRKGALRRSFTTRNVHDSERLNIDVRLARGPLSFLRGQWRFLPHGQGGCRIEFEINYEFANRFLDVLLSPMFAAVYERMIDAFAARARQVYGTDANENPNGQD